MIEPVSGTKDPTLFGAVLRNSMLVEDSLLMIVLELMFLSERMIGNLL